MAKENDSTEFILGTTKVGNTYRWLKLPTNFFDTPEVRVLEKTDKDGFRYEIFLLKLLLLAIQQDEIGVLRFKPNIPYNAKILANVLDLEFDLVKTGLDLFTNLGIIEDDEEGNLLIEMVIPMVGSLSDQAIRMRKFRAKNENKQIEREPSHSAQSDVDTDLDLDLEKDSNSSDNTTKNHTDYYSFFKSLSGKSKGKLLDTENNSTNTIEQVYNYIPIYEQKTGRTVIDKPAFICRALKKNWDLTGENYCQWANEKLKEGTVKQ